MATETINKNTSLQLSAAEMRMAAEQFTNPASTAYNINFLAYKAKGNFDIEKFKNALNQVVADNTVLRSYYVSEGGELIRKIREPGNINIEIIENFGNDAKNHILDSDKPYDITKDPLYRFKIYKHTDGSYTLHFAFHHIVMDGSSFVSFIKQLNAAYNGLPYIKPQYEYADFAVWQNTVDTTAEEAVFKDMFADGLPETEMPTFPIRPDILPQGNTRVREKVLTADLDTAAKKYGVTKYEFLMAALGIAVAKYMGCEDAVIGTAMAGRTKPEVRDVIGMFVTTLPVRVKPKAQMPADEYVSKVKETVAAVKQSQNYAFEKLVPSLTPEVNASRNPVYDVIFNYLQQFPQPEFEGVDITTLDLPRQSLNIDIQVEALSAGDYFDLIITYSDKLYDKAIIENFMEQLLTVIRRLKDADKKTPLKIIAELPKTQRDIILNGFAGKKTDENLGKTVADLFREQAKRTPDNIAVVSGDKRLSYAELDRITDNLAAYLLEKGLKPDGVAGIMVERGFMMPIGSLAAMKAGAAYLPLDPAYPSERLSFMIADANADVLICDPKYKDKILDYNGIVIDTEQVFMLPDAPAPGTAPKPEDTMILLYTSGTTGNPKGVMLTHANLVNFITMYAREHGLTENDKVAAYASFGFDACMMDMYPTLISGAELHIIPEDMRLDLPALKEYFENNTVTVAFMTTQLGRQFAQSGGAKGLRALSVGGETLTPLSPPPFGFYNVYGPTECTVFVTDYQVDKLYDRVPIGLPVDNTELYVTDINGDLAPVGVAGELNIAGRQVGTGYLNRPDLNAEKFVKNPFSNDPDYSRIYKTGDIVRYLPNGAIDFVGRRDMQVKIRGFRVELTEIEGRIREFPGIADATVTAIDDAAGGKRIVAYVVSNSPVDIGALHAFIAETLPPYMVPAATMQIDKIPLNQNGKVDRRKLPKIVLKADEIVKPKTDAERLIFNVISEILGANDFGITTDLMYAGLNSLSAIKAAAKITEESGKRLSTVDIMREKTIERIAKTLEAGETYKTKLRTEKEDYPLTQNQLGLYFACVKNPATLEYNIPLAMGLPQGVSAEKLAQSINTVIDAHPYLNAEFLVKGAEPRQKPGNNQQEIEVVKCGYNEYLSEKGSFVRPFNLFEGPLYRVKVFDTDKGVFALLDFHHIIFDGASLDIFMRDLSDVYSGKAIEPEKYNSFDLALENSMRSGEALDKAKSYYEKKLSDMEGATKIPEDYASNTIGSPKKASAKLVKSRIEGALKGLGVTNADLFLAAAALTTGRFAGTRDVRIASVNNGRDGAEVQRSMGMLVKTLPVIIGAEGNLSAQEFINGARASAIDAYKNSDYPYINAASDFNYNSQVLFAYQGGVINDYKFNGENAKIEMLSLGNVKFPLTLNVWDEGDTFNVELEYNSALFEPHTMDNFVKSVAHTAEELLRKADAKLTDISVSSTEQILETDSFNPPPAPYKDYGLHTLIEQLAETKPTDTALIAADGKLTFAELNARANRLANALIKKGVKKGDKIAFILPRTSSVITAMLGIMKAGAAYIPVDPEYPEERITHVLEDSHARYIIGDSKTEFENALDITELLYEINENNPNIPVSGNDAAYAIYTSGSTGKPKGVLINHANILNYVDDTPQNRHVHALTDKGCAMVSVTTVSFDMFLKEAFITLMNGLTLILADDEQAKNPDKLAKLFKDAGGTAFNATPSRMLQYMELPEIRDALANCKVIMAGGEGYPSRLYNKLREVTGATLINTYGPTEITVSSNAKILTDNNVNIGAPLAGVFERIMDIEGQPLPQGAVGELYIGGSGVAEGYLNNKQMTSERFIEFDGQRYYKSGDLARFTPSGEVQVLGRNDGQIKLRGLRIELGEIENAIASHPDVAECAAVVRPINGQEHLCAYYTAKREISPEEMRKFVSKSLTKYMVPTAYMQLDTMPMTPNGKTDKKSLPDARLMLNEDYMPPADDIEKAFCDIFAEVLTLDRVGALDSFFDLGGTSLLVTRVTIEASHRGFAISYGDVFSNPTPKELAARVKGDFQPLISPAEENYDYSQINSLLKENTLEALINGDMRNLGNICISGATGFLGIHILKEFLDTEKGAAYCIVRGGEKRLKSMLVYYFSDSFDELFGTRIIPIDGDITNPNTFEKLEKYPIDTYINCAANVKHFSSGTDIEDVNVKGTSNAIAFCERKGCRFIQISTASVAGMRIDDKPGKETVLNEKSLYFGQDLSNKYVNSKFLAERLTFEAALRGLDAKVMRVGNLMARDSDGEFQANFNTNSFLGRIKAYYIIGKIAYGDMGATTELAPIDYTAKAILALSKTPKECRVFHPYNDHNIYMADIINTLKKNGIEITPCEKDEYIYSLGKAMLDKNKASHLNALIAYNEHGRQVESIKSQNAYTSQVLLRLGFSWPITEKAYLKAFFDMMDGLGFFDTDKFES